MPSDDDDAGLAPADGPDWENGFSDSLRRFEDDIRTWKKKEVTASDTRASARNLSQRAVASCDFAAEDCLKAHFPDRADNSGEGDAPLQTLLTVARGQRKELKEVLELVRKHAEEFDGHTDLADQLKETGTASQKKSGSDVVALLASLLDVAARSLGAARKRNSGRQRRRDLRDDEEMRRGDGHDRSGRYDARGAREGGRVRDRERDPPARGRDDYRYDDRRREDDDYYRRGGGGRGENGYRRGNDDRMAAGTGGRREASGRSRSRGEVRRASGRSNNHGDREVDRQDRGRGGRQDDEDEEETRPPPSRKDSRPRRESEQANGLHQTEKE